MGHSPAQGVAQPADPVTDLAGQDQVVVFGLKGPPGGSGFVVEDVAQPLGEFLVLIDFSNRQF